MTKMVFFDVTERDKAQLSAAFEGSGHDIQYFAENASPELLDDDAEVVSVFVSSIVDAVIINKAPRLRFIACRSTGFNNIDLETAHTKNILVANVPTYGTDTVAEYTFGLLLSLTRKIPEAIAAAKGGQHDTDSLTGIDLAGKTMGVVGTGRIGARVAELAKAFGMHVVAYDKFPQAKVADMLDIKYMGLDELVSTSDVISLHAPYTADNHHMFDAGRFNRVKRGAILLNTARGELVDSQALIDALRNGQIAGAGLDVIEGEKLHGTDEEMLLLSSENAEEQVLRDSLEISILQKLPTVIITNHNAFNSQEALERITKTSVQNIQAFINGNPENIVQ